MIGEHCNVGFFFFFFIIQNLLCDTIKSFQVKDGQHYIIKF